MFSFIKKHLYLCDFVLFCLGFASAILGYCGLIKSKMVLAVCMLLPIFFGLIFFLLAVVPDVALRMWITGNTPKCCATGLTHVSIAVIKPQSSDYPDIIC